MPLIHSKSQKAFKKNVETEMRANPSKKDRAQNLAIAYSMQRRAKAKKMAEGGDITTRSDKPHTSRVLVEGVNRDIPIYDREHNEVKHGQSHMGTSVRRGDMEGAKKVAYSTIREGRNVAGGKSKRPLEGLAEGGEINAKNERRPMPDNTYDDAKMADQNRGMKPPKNDSWTGQPTTAQAQSNNGRMVRPLKHPKMVPQSNYSVRLRDEEDDLQSSSRPGPYDAQPPARDDEEGPNRQGPKVPDMAPEHSTKRKPYAKGGEIEPGDEDSRNINTRTSQEPEDHEIQARARLDEADLEDKASPSEDEGTMDARSRDEDDQDRQGPDVPDMEDEHVTGRKPYHSGGYADGGTIQYDQAMGSEDNEDDSQSPSAGEESEYRSDDQPGDEEDDEHDSSVAAAVMSRMRKMGRLDSGSEDEDASFEDEPRPTRDRTYPERSRYAEGGEITKGKSQDIHSHGSYDSDDSDEADLSRNADEDANEEDQMSFDALRKENYSTEYLDADHPMDSNMTGDDEESDAEDVHDRSIADKIRAKMRQRSPMTR